jgi:magnesium chelatase family protein
VDVVSNVLLARPARAGKTLLARVLRSILPRMDFEEALDVTRMYSVADQMPPGSLLVRRPPLRAPITPFPTSGW